MFEITNTVINKSGHEVVEDYTYNLSISINENVLHSVSCQISKKVLVDMQVPEGVTPQKAEHTIQVGAIQFANGQLSSQINFDEDSITHLAKFSEYMKEIKAGLPNPDVKTLKK